MENNNTLEKWKSLGVKTVSVAKGEAIAVNPYESQEGIVKWAQVNILPPIPAPNIEPGLYEIELFEPELKWQYHTPNMPDTWNTINSFPFKPAYEDTPFFKTIDEMKEKCPKCGYRQVIVLKEQVKLHIWDKDDVKNLQEIGKQVSEEMLKAEQVEGKPEGESEWMELDPDYRNSHNNTGFYCCRCQKSLKTEGVPIRSVDVNLDTLQVRNNPSGRHLIGENCWKKVLKAHKKQAASTPQQPEAEPVERTAEESVIDFACWYSGMDKQKVQKAYQRYLKETQKS